MMELLAPAGGMEQLRTALRFGADAVYGGLRRFGLRASADNFGPEELAEALRLVHGAGKRFYLTLNILPHDEEMEDLVRDAAQARELGVDAAIVSDLGAFSLLRQRVPELPLHVSTQANIMNAAAARVWTDLGAARIVLSRELSLEQIAALKRQLPGKVELEAFVHGAMCMAHSGRCMLSDYLTGRGANRGACTQPCRWEYTVLEAKRPEEPLPVLEDERGTYIFSAYDLNMLEHLPEMREAGIVSLKIEGRMKTDYYVAVVTRAYRAALDALEQSEKAYQEALPALREELDKASHRVSNTGFYLGAPQPSSGAGHTTQTMQYVGRVLETREGWLRIEIKNRIDADDRLELLSPGGVQELTVSRILREDTGEEVSRATVAGQRILIPAPFPAEEGDFLRK